MKVLIKEKKTDIVLGKCHPISVSHDCARGSAVAGRSSAITSQPWVMHVHRLHRRQRITDLTNGRRFWFWFWSWFWRKWDRPALFILQTLRRRHCKATVSDPGVYVVLCLFVVAHCFSVLRATFTEDKLL